MRGSHTAAVLLLCALLSGCTGAPGPEGAPAPQGGSAPQGAPAPEGGPGGITVGEARELPPLAPAGVRVEQSGGQVAVLWRGTRSPVARYEVYRRVGAAPGWQLAGTLPALPDDSGQYRWVDQAPAAGAAYGVAAVSPHGVRSDMATP